MEHERDNFKRPAASARINRSVLVLAVAGAGTTMVLALLLLDIAAAVSEMREDEETLEASLQLGNGVREQYIHEAHTLIERTRSHVPHYHAWVARAEAAEGQLRGRVPQGTTWRLRRIATASREVDRRFRESLLPALEAGDDERVVREHRVSEELVTQAASDADAIAAALQARMQQAHIRAERGTQRCLFVSVGGGLFVLLIAAWNARSLRSRVLQPMESLLQGTRQIAAGKPPETAAIDGDREVAALGLALASLWSDLEEREARLVHGERVAALGTMAAAIAHELNNPVGVIRGYLRTMIPEAEHDALRAELSILDEEARTCQRLVEDLLSLARQERLRRSPTELAALARTVVDRLATSGELGATSVDVEMEEATLDVDAGRIAQLLANILRNAAQAVPRTQPRVVLRGRALPDAYELTCRDFGPGVPAHMREGIFEPFVSDKATGTGLGLAVCRVIVRAHGGSIEVSEPRQGEGAEFRIALPATRSSGAPPSEESV